MTNKEINAVQVWKEFEDLVIPRLRLTVLERAVYTHLLRHSRLEGKRQIRFSIQSFRACGPRKLMKITWR